MILGDNILNFGTGTVLILKMKAPGNINIKYLSLLNSVADPGCLSRIPDPNFSISDPGSKTIKIPDPGSVLKNLSVLTQTIVS